MNEQLLPQQLQRSENASLPYDQTPLPSSSVGESSFLSSPTSTRSKRPSKNMKQCLLCSYKTLYSSNLKQHMATHSDKKPLACSQCAFRTNYPRSLKQHMVTHSGTAPFVCPQCPYRASQSGRLKQHMFTHSATKQFACPQCPYRASQSWNLKQHMFTHSGTKQFACPECPYRANRSGNLKEHMFTHSATKQFACPQCPYRACQNGTLKRHLLTHSVAKQSTCTSMTVPNAVHGHGQSSYVLPLHRETDILTGVYSSDINTRSSNDLIASTPGTFCQAPLVAYDTVARTEHPSHPVNCDWLDQTEKQPALPVTAIPLGAAQQPSNPNLREGVRPIQNPTHSIICEQLNCDTPSIPVLDFNTVQEFLQEVEEQVDHSYEEK